MMDQTEKCSNKVIFVTGPSYGGKTHFIGELLQKYPNAYPINFELFFNGTDGYRSFYEYVDERLKSHNLVIAESVNSYTGWNHKWCPFDFKDRIDILVRPDKQQYVRNYNKYRSVFGRNLTDKRAGNISVDKLYLDTKMPCGHYYHYNGSNLDVIMAEVDKYVLGNPNNNNR